MSYPSNIAPAPQRPVSGRATASLVLGIVAILGGACLLFVPNIAGIILGHLALRDIRQTGMDGRSRAIAGLWLSYATFVILAYVATMVTLRR